MVVIMNYDAIASAMMAEINNPQRLYMPNSPGSFVQQRLTITNFAAEAAWFWSGYCSRIFGVPELDELNVKLSELAANEKMPDWGTKGT